MLIEFGEETTTKEVVSVIPEVRKAVIESLSDDERRTVTMKYGYPMEVVYLLGRLKDASTTTGQREISNFAFDMISIWDRERDRPVSAKSKTEAPNDD